MSRLGAVFGTSGTRWGARRSTLRGRLLNATGTARALCEVLEPRQMLAVDLAGSFIFGGGNFAPGASIIDVPLTVTNSGDTVSDFVPIRFVLSLNNIAGDDDDIILNSFPIDAVPGGGQVGSVESLVIPTDVAAGSYFLLMLVDPDNHIEETDEGNNVFVTPTANVVVAGAPVFADLTVSLGPLAGTFVPGQEVQGSITIRNLGLAVGDNFITKIVLSRDTIFDESDFTIEDIPEMGLGGFRPGEVFTGSGSIFIPNVIPSGSYYLMAIIDVLNTVEESDETNNIYRSATASVIIAPPPVVSIVATDAAAGETNNPGRYRVTRTGPTTLPLTVTIVIGGTATMGDDYEPISTTVFIAAGSATAFIDLRVIDDSLAEPSETVVLSLADGPGYVVSATQAIATVNIADNEPTISVVRTRHAGETPANTGLFTFTRAGGVNSGSLTVFYTVSGGTATQGADYEALSGMVTFAAGSATATVTVTGIDDQVIEAVETINIQISANTSYRVSATHGSATMNLTDNEPTVTLRATDAIASETAGDTATFTFTRTGGLLSAPLTVRFAILQPTTLSGGDYIASPVIPPNQVIVFAAGSATATITITGVDDNLVENDETLTLSVISDPSYHLGSAITATVTMRDNEPTITLVATDAIASETAGDTATFTFTRTGGPLTEPFTVRFGFGQPTTMIGSDFIASPLIPPNQVITFAAGSATATITITGVDDNIAEGDETLTLFLIADTSYRLGSATTATVTMRDNEPVISVLATDAVASETPGNPAVFTFTRAGGNIAATYTVNYTIGAGTAIAGDYMASLPLSGQITFAAGATTATITITPVDDAVAEPSETLILILSPSVFYNLGAASSATITILDNEPIVSVVAATAVASEGGTAPLRFRLTRASGSTTGPLTVDFTFLGTAVMGDDFQAIPLSATFAPGQTTVMVEVNILTDLLAEPQETVILQLSGSAAYRLSTTQHSATGRINDNTPTISITATDAIAGEALVGGNPNTGRVTLRRTGPTAGTLTVNYVLLGTTTAGADYVALPGSVTFAAGSATAVVDIMPIDDSVADFAETVIVQLGWGAGYRMDASRSAATITITDDEPVVSISASGAASETNAAPARFTIRRTGPTTDDLTVQYTVSGTATSGDDYVALSGTIIIPAGQASAVLTVTPIDDMITEPAETIIVSLVTTAACSASVTQGAATATIADNEPNVSIRATDAQAGEAGDPARFTVTRTGPITQDLIVSYTLGGFAQNGIDYAALSGQVTILAGSRTAVITVNPLQDTLGEGNESVVVVLAADPSYRIVPATSMATAIISDDEPIVTLQAVALNTSEGGSALARIVFRRSGIPTQPVTISYMIGANGTATPGVDFVIPPGTITIPAGVTTALLEIAAIDDDEGESSETIFISLTGNDGYQIGNPAILQILILDNEPTVSAAATAAIAEESGSRNGRFTLTRTGPLNDPLTVSYSVHGTAIDGTDFQSLSGSVMFAANARTATINILAIQDLVGELEETVQIRIEAGPGYRAVNPLLLPTVTINDDEPLVRITAADNRATEGPTDTARFMFTRIGVVSGALTVTYSVSGSASSSDFELSGAAGVIFFAPGQTTATLTLTALVDLISENDETVIVTVTGNDGYRPAPTQNQATATIIANGPAVSVTAVDGAAAEILTGVANPGTFRITRTGSLAAAMQVFFHFAGTAVAGDDFTSPGGSIILPAGIGSMNIPINVIDDLIGEDPETVILVLDAMDEYRVSPTQGFATVTIADNEARVTLAMPDGVATENTSDTARFTVTRTGPRTQALTVNYIIEGTATNGVDYQLLSGTVVIAAGSAVGTIIIAALPDVPQEMQETVKITLVTGDGYKVMGIDNRTAVINNLAQADLTVTGLTYSPATYSLGTPGQMLALQIDLANDGPAAAGVFMIEIRLSLNDTYGDADDFVLTFTSVAGLDALTISTLSLLISLDACPVPPTPGTYHVGVRIDSGRRVTEMSETNNDFFSPVADIVITA